MSRLSNGRTASCNAARDNPGSASRVGRGKTPECYGRRQKTAKIEKMARRFLRLRASVGSCRFRHRHQKVLADAVAEQVDAIHEIGQPRVQAMCQDVLDSSVVQLCVQQTGLAGRFA